MKLKFKDKAFQTVALTAVLKDLAEELDKEEALKLAHEHYYFCCDRVEQYAADYTIGKLAHCLTQSKV